MCYSRNFIEVNISMACHASPGHRTCRVQAQVRHAPIARQSHEPAIDRACEAGAAKCCDVRDVHQRHLSQRLIGNLIKKLIQPHEREGTLEVVEGTNVASMPAHIARPIYCEQRRSSLCDACRVDSMPTGPPPDLGHRATGHRLHDHRATSIVGLKENGAVIIHDARAADPSHAHQVSIYTHAGMAPMENQAWSDELIHTYNKSSQAWPDE